MRKILPNIKHSIFSTTLMVILLVSGCGGSPQDRLVGTWQEIDGEQNIIEFFSDGSFSLNLDKGDIGSMEKLNGKWLVLEDGRLKLDISMFGTTQSIVGKLDFDGGEMVLTDDNGKATRHKRLTTTGGSGLSTTSERAVAPPKSKDVASPSEFVGSWKGSAKGGGSSKGFPVALSIYLNNVNELTGTGTYPTPNPAYTCTTNLVLKSIRERTAAFDEYATAGCDEEKVEFTMVLGDGDSAQMKWGGPDGAVATIVRE